MLHIHIALSLARIAAFSPARVEVPHEIKWKAFAQTTRGESHPLLALASLSCLAPFLPQVQDCLSIKISKSSCQCFHLCSC